MNFLIFQYLKAFAKKKSAEPLISGYNQYSRKNRKFNNMPVLSKRVYETEGIEQAELLEKSQVLNEVFRTIN